MGVGYLIDPKGGAVTVEIPKDLDSYYKLLDCNTIDIVRRKIGGKYYDIVCDDEAMLKKDVYISMLARSWDGVLTGKLFICNHDKNGNEVGLTPEDIENIKKHIYNIYIYNTVERSIRCYVEGEH